MEQLRKFYRSIGKETFHESQFCSNSWCLLREEPKSNFRRAVVKLIMLLERESIRRSVCAEE